MRVPGPATPSKSRNRFNQARRSRCVRLESLEARLALAADLVQLLASEYASQVPGPLPFEATTFIESKAASLTADLIDRTTPGELPSEILLSFAGDVSPESMQAQLKLNLEVSRLNLKQGVAVQRLVTFQNAAGDWQTLARLKLGQSQDAIAARDVLQRASGVTGAELNYACAESSLSVTCDSSEGQARAYLISQARSLGLDSPMLDDLTHYFTHTLSFGTVERFEQHVAGIPVYEGEIAVTITDAGAVAYVYNGYVPDLQLAETKPAIDAAAARETALASLNITSALSHDSNQLIVFPTDVGARLAYQVTLVPTEGTIGTYEVIVAADSGEILQSLDLANNVNGTGMVFNPDPLSTAGVAYGATGFSDANDADTTQLNAQRQSVTLPDITLSAGTYRLVGPYAQIVDVESPFNGLFTQATSTFNFTRTQSGFEAVNVYYHIDKFMRYLNVTLGVNVSPTQYTGGAKFDPHGLSGEDNAHYDPSNGVVAFGEGGVDDAEDADVIIHELGHAIHDWVTGENLSQVNGLSEGTGDYFAQSYSRALGLWATSNPAYHYVYHWDGHNEYWGGRTTNYSALYPGGLTGSIHTDGQIWSTANMKVWDALGAAKTDAMMVEGLAMTGSSTNQQAAAQALLQAAFNRGYTTAELNSIYNIYTATGYIVTIPTPPTQLAGTVWHDVNGNANRDAGDNGQSGWTVFLDTNDNAVVDSQTGNRPSSDVPKTIADLSTVTSQTTVTGFVGNVTDLNVTLSLTHTYDADLTITLISPGGIRVELASNVGGSGNNFTNTVFDQQAATSITSGSPPFTGTFRPEGSLNTLNGTPANGLWRLEIVDGAAQDTGSLSAWSLQFSTGELSTVTSATGGYQFTNPPTGNHVVREVVQATWTQTVPASGSHQVTLASGQSMTGLDFANTQAPPTFQVTTLTPTPTGAVIDLNRDLDASQLNLYDVEGNPLGPTDVTLVGQTTGAVRGSLIVDPGLRRVSFVATSGTLAPDTYTLTLRSAADGFRDTTMALLDGDSNAAAGGNYVQTFVVTAPAANAVTVSLPNFARGPEQPLNFPATAATGIPLSLSNGLGITAATLELRYNPALLTISAATVAAGLPGGANVTLNTSTPGIAVIQFASATPLSAGATNFVNLQASVPTTATYRSKHVLDLANVVLNGGAIPALADDAVHVVAYYADASGNGTYGSTDASRVARVAVGLDSGFSQYRLLDPIIVGDISGNNSLTATDTSRVLQAAVGLPVAEVPALPAPAVSLVQGGPDPKLSVPTNLVASVGGSLVIPVHIDSIVDLTGNGLEAADLVLYYDPAVLDVSTVELGALLAAAPGQWSLAANIDRLAGRIIVSAAGTVPLEGLFAGELLKLNARVRSAASTGATTINLAASARDPQRFTQLNDGYLTLIPAPTDAANDPGVDGVVTIVPALGTPHGDRAARDLALLQFLSDWTNRSVTQASADAFLAAVRPRRR